MCKCLTALKYPLPNHTLTYYIHCTANNTYVRLCVSVRLCMCFAQNFGKNESRKPFARFHPAQNYGWSKLAQTRRLKSAKCWHYNDDDIEDDNDDGNDNSDYNNDDDDSLMRCHLTDRTGLDSNRDCLAARTQIVTLLRFHY